MIEPLAESIELHARAQAFVTATLQGRVPSESFESLGAAVASFQYRNIDGYKKLCTARGISVEPPFSLSRMPAVPTDAFRWTRVSAFSERDTNTTFRTSGTTVKERGVHSLRTSATYDFACVPWARAFVEPSKDERFAVLVLGPSQAELVDSSLTHMLTQFVRAWGTPESGFFVRDGVTEIEKFARVIQALERPALVAGTSFAFVHLLDELGDRSLPLPSGSIVMHTGGFKGRSREVPIGELTRSMAIAFDIPKSNVRSEYGMTELSSQFYEINTSKEGNAVYVAPAWARVIAVDPMSLAPVSDGEIGIARIEDLLNIDSAWAVQTADRVRQLPHGFELLGRMPGSAPRGCSLSLEEILT